VAHKISRVVLHIGATVNLHHNRIKWKEMKHVETGPVHSDHDICLRYEKGLILKARVFFGAIKISHNEINSNFVAFIIQV